MPQRAVDIAHLKANFARRFSCNRGHAAFPRAISESGTMAPFSPSLCSISGNGDLIIWFLLHGRPDSRGEAQWAEGEGDIFLAVHLCDTTGQPGNFRRREISTYNSRLRLKHFKNRHVENYNLVSAPRAGMMTQYKIVAFVIQTHLTVIF